MSSLRDVGLMLCIAALDRLMAEGRPVTSPLTGAEMGSTLRPNLFVRSLVRGRVIH
jgi:hypothetical protein